jgi:hypothetical protein
MERFQLSLFEERVENFIVIIQGSIRNNSWLFLFGDCLSKGRVLSNDRVQCNDANS